jgi:predicted AlkP superfamily phosphohydrolase/phosphomutase
LIPKSHKLFIKPTAEKVGENEILVADVVGFYYSEVRKSLTDIESINVKIDLLGTFTIKAKELNKLKDSLTSHLKRLENPETFNQMRVKKDIEEKFEKVTKASELMESEKARKKQIKTSRYEKD